MSSNTITFHFENIKFLPAPQNKYIKSALRLAPAVKAWFRKFISYWSARHEAMPVAGQISLAKTLNLGHAHKATELIIDVENEVIASGQ